MDLRLYAKDKTSRRYPLRLRVPIPRGNPMRFTSNIRTIQWAKLAPLRAICLSILSLVQPQIRPPPPTKRKPPDNEDTLPPMYIASIQMILTSSPLSPSPFDQTVLFTHATSNLQPHCVSSNIHTIVHPTEKQMLLAFRDFLIQYDPDLITGYDVCEDISEIIDRAKDINLPKNFPYIARPSSTALKPR
jgi:DNA polymerase elongation subunit (family B)